jgi:hypothetical protein
VLRRIRPKLPNIVALSSAPFMRPDGSICSTVGFDEATGVYLLDSLDIDVPESPTAEDLTAAVALIDEMIFDFPLPDATARAHVFSALLTPAVRHLVPLAPLHYYSANQAGVGKNLLSESLLYIHRGEWPPTDPLPTDEEEARKQITSLIAEGASVVLWDEAHLLIGRQVARLLTSTKWRDRVLGKNVTIEAQNTLSAFALGNNGEIVGDLRRRVVLISMESPIAQPSRRTGFRHTDLRVWVEQHRTDLLDAVLTMLRAWHVAGRPGVESPLGSFEPWCNLVGGTLSVAGVDGFLGNVDEVLEESDHLDEEMAVHVEMLAEAFQSAEFTVRDVVERATWNATRDTIELPSGIRASDPGAGEHLGKLYRRFQKRVWPSGWRIVKRGISRGRQRWAVECPGE